MKARFFNLGVGGSRPPSREGKSVLVTNYNVCEGFSRHYQAIFGHQLDVLQFSPISDPLFLNFVTIPPLGVERG